MGNDILVNNNFENAQGKYYDAILIIYLEKERLIPFEYIGNNLNKNKINENIDCSNKYLKENRFEPSKLKILDYLIVHIFNTSEDYWTENVFPALLANYCKNILKGLSDQQLENEFYRLGNKAFNFIRIFARNRYYFLI